MCVKPCSCAGWQQSLISTANTCLCLSTSILGLNSSLFIGSVHHTSPFYPFPSSTCAASILETSWTIAIQLQLQYLAELLILTSSLIHCLAHCLRRAQVSCYKPKVFQEARTRSTMPHHEAPKIFVGIDFGTT
jgi:hypothetical protein